MRRFTLLLCLIIVGLTTVNAAVGTVEAETYDGNSGAKTAGDGVGYVKNDTWIMFSDVEFTGDETGFSVNITGLHTADPVYIEFRLGSSTGDSIGSILLSSTGDNETSEDIITTTGTYDLYLVFKSTNTGYLFDMDYFEYIVDLPTYTITTDVSPASSGLITRGDDGPDYNAGVDVALTATENVGYIFNHWEDGNGTSISTDNPVTITIAMDTTVIAVFTETATFVLDTAITNGTINVSPTPTDVDGEALFNTGTTLTLTASPTYGYMFSHWEDSEGSTVSEDSIITFDITSDTNLTAITEEITEYALPSWNFDYEYVETDTGSYTYSDPTYLPRENGIESDAWIFPDNKTMGLSVGLTGHSSSFYTTTTGDNIVCRILWEDANKVSDLTDESQHNQYYQFQFPTTGFMNIGLDFTFSGGQSTTDDSLAIAYSVDEGTTWLDGGRYGAADHWNTFLNYTPELNEADNQELVIVRLIGLTATTGSNRNFNLDEFSVTGNTIDPSMIAYWKFDEDTLFTIADEAGTRNGTLINIDDTAWIEGYVGPAIDFSENDSSNGFTYAQIPADESIAFGTTSFSVSLLVKGDETIGTEQSIFSKGIPYIDNGGWYHLSFKNDALRFMIWDSSSMSSPAGVLPDNFPTNEWVHVVCVRDVDSDSLYVYLNGILLDKCLDEVGDISSDGNLYFGLTPHPDWSGQYYGGLDEVQIYDKALSATSVKAIAENYGFEPILGDNDNLGSLIVNNESQFILSDLTRYTYDVDYGTTDVPAVSATAEDEAATINVVQAADISDSTKIIVTAENGVDSTIYWVVYIIGDPSTDASLSDITVSVGTLTPEFVTTTKEYTDTVPNATTAVTVTATTTHSGASATGVGEITLSSDETVVTINVLAQDGETSDSYSVTIIKGEVGFDESIFNNTIAYFSAEQLIVNSSVLISKVEMFDVSGQQIMSKQTSAEEIVISTDEYNLKTSVYLVRIFDTENNSATFKVFK